MASLLQEPNCSAWLPGLLSGQHWQHGWLLPIHTMIYVQIMTLSKAEVRCQDFARGLGVGGGEGKAEGKSTPTN